MSRSLGKVTAQTIHPHLLNVIAAAGPEVKLDLSVEAEDLSDMRHLPHPGHHLEHALGSPVFLKSIIFLNVKVHCELKCVKFFFTGCLICSWTLVGLIWVFHHLRFCQIPISPGRIGHSVKLKIQVNPTQSTSRWDTLYVDYSARITHPCEDAELVEG